MQKLMTKAIARRVPPLYAQDGKGRNAIVYAHYFTASTDFYMTEYNPATNDAFGYIKSFPDAGEFGYFNINEMERHNRGTSPLRHVERDVYFDAGKPLHEYLTD